MDLPKNISVKGVPWWPSSLGHYSMAREVQGSNPEQEKYFTWRENTKKNIFHGQAGERNKYYTVLVQRSGFYTSLGLVRNYERLKIHHGSARTFNWSRSQVDFHQQ